MGMTLSLSFAQSPQALQQQLQASQAGGLGLNFDPGTGMNSGLPSIQSMGSINAPVINGSDPKALSPSLLSTLALKPQKPNEFQTYLLQTTGQSLKVFGSDFFENSSGSQSSTSSPFIPLVNIPATPDYVLGSGDQLLVRAWGSVNINYQATLDRNGLIALPKVGAISLSGVKLSKAEGVIDQAISKYYKNYELNVTLGQTRAISVYVVGQARRAGSYSLSSLSTLSSAVFASGGPNSNGSMRHVQLKRGNAVVSEFDTYEFLAQGRVDNDVKLIDGDVIVYPPLLGQVALLGNVNAPAIYEINSNKESLKDLLKVAGGMSLLADPTQVTIERIQGDGKSVRPLEGIDLTGKSEMTSLDNGDVVHFYPKRPEVASAVTLRGAVTQAKKVPWRSGMRVHDLIPSREYLVSSDTLRRQNEVLFDVNERERAQRAREQIPADLLQPNQKSEYASEEGQRLRIEQGINSPKAQNSIQQLEAPRSSTSYEAWQKSQDIRLIAQLPKIDEAPAKSLIERVGQLLEKVNLDYAVIERVNTKDLSVKVIAFNLGNAIDDPSLEDNQELMPGDVVTVFSLDDMQVPITKRQVLVRIEGEVNRPGVYQMKSNETLKELIEKAGGVTRDAFLFGAGLYREDVKKTQIENLDKLIRKLETESSASLAQLSQSLGASADANILQAKLLAAQQAQKQAIERVRTLKPEGRIALGLEPNESGYVSQLPSIKLRNNDLFKVPSRPDFVYVYGSVNSESAIIYHSGWVAQDYLKVSGVSSGADKDGLILIRSDGTAFTSSNNTWGSTSLNEKVYPGDTLVVPEKLDRESVWSSVFRNTKDLTQIFYNLGLGAAAIKTLKN